MATKEQRGLSKKRKRGGGSKGGEGRGEKPSNPKKQKYISSGSSKSPQAKGFKKSAPNSKPKPSLAKDSKRAPPKLKAVKAAPFGKADASIGDNGEVLSKKDRRLVAKVLVNSVCSFFFFLHFTARKLRCAP